MTVPYLSTAVPGSLGHRDSDTLCDKTKWRQAASERGAHTKGAKVSVGPRDAQLADARDATAKNNPHVSVRNGGRDGRADRSSAGEEFE